MIAATSRASRSGTVFAAVSSCSSAASARAGSRSGTLAMPSANSSSMLSKLPCPFIGAQSPLSTTSRAFIDASSLFSDVVAVALADFALDVRVLGRARASGRAGPARTRARPAPCLHRLAPRSSSPRAPLRTVPAAGTRNAATTARGSRSCDSDSPCACAIATEAANADSSDATASSHMPSGRNTCDGMWRAWLDAGAMRA